MMQLYMLHSMTHGVIALLLFADTSVVHIHLSRHGTVMWPMYICPPLLCCTWLISNFVVQVQLLEMDGQGLHQLMDSIQGLPQHAKTIAGGVQQVGCCVAKSPELGALQALLKQICFANCVKGRRLCLSSVCQLYWCRKAGPPSDVC